MFLPKQFSPFRKILLLAILAFTVIEVRAQFVDYGEDPANYKWNIVRTTHYNIIYPQGNDSMAYRYASLLETSYPRVKNTIGTPMKARFPVVLHPGNMLSNGMVSWAPRRMEIVSTPSSDLYAQSWDRQLVLHESRHVFQTGKLLKGIYKPFYYLIGEQAEGLSALFAPNWFFEGDAVATETALSSSGRGRLPEFSMIYRAHKMSGKFYSFNKWNLGSYEDYTGSYYALGYNLTAFARYKHGANTWDEVTNRYVKRFSIPPFSASLKHYTGMSSQGLFDATFAYLTREWERQDSIYKQTNFSPGYLSPLTKRYSSYKYPQSLNDQTVIALKSGIDDINSLVMIENGQEKRLSYLGSINSRIVYNSKSNRVYWTEYISGLRWTHQNYSVLKYYDLKSDQIYTVTPNKRYQSPAIHTDGRKAAVSEFSPEGDNHIVLINLETGEESARYPVPDNAFAKELTYAEGDTIIVTVIGDDGIRLLQLNAQADEWSELMKSTFTNIASTIWKDGKLLFESGLDGTNNIYSLDTRTLQLQQLTTARFGAFTPSMSSDNKQLLFSDYQTAGYRLASVPVSNIPEKPASFDKPYHFELADSISRQENFNLDTATIQPVDFQPKRYHKASHLFKIHSWAPFYYDVMDAVNLQTDDFTTIVKPGAMVVSQNTLNTAVAQAGWYYKEGYHHGKLAFTYSGLYPVFDLTVDYGDKAFDIAWKKNEEDKDILTGYYPGRNLIETEVRAYVPINLTRNHWVCGLQPSVTYNYSNNRYQEYGSGEFHYFQYLLSELRFYNYRKMAKRDILPRWGYQMRFQYLSSPYNGGNFGNLLATQLTTYFPGIVRSDGLMLRFGYQYQTDGKIYLPKKLINEPRGYNYNSRTRQLIALKGDYSFRMFSPDIALGPVIYIQRVRSNVFYDLSFNQAKKHESWGRQSSFGADFILDCNLLEATFPISLGARVIQPIDYGDLQVEALFTIIF